MEQNQLQRDNLSLAINWYEEQTPNGKALIYKKTLHLIQTEIEYDSNESKSRKYHAPKRMRSINHSLPGNEMCTGCSPSYPIHYMPIINPKWFVQTRECKILMHRGVWPVELGWIASEQKMKKGRKKNSVKKKVRRLWARSRANKDNASGQGSEVNNERKSRTAVKSVTATKRTDFKAAQTPQQKQKLIQIKKNTQLEKTQDLHRAFKMRKQSDY